VALSADVVVLVMRIRARSGCRTRCLTQGPSARTQGRFSVSVCICFTLGPCPYRLATMSCCASAIGLHRSEAQQEFGTQLA